MTVSGAALAGLWPHARDAGAVLAAQGDPAELSDLQINSALRNSQNMVADHIEAALAAGDADLANSFVDLAREKNISLAERTVAAGERCRRRGKFLVAFCQAVCQWARHRKCRGRRQSVGTVAGDLFVFGDIRDVVRESKHLVTGEDTDRLVLGLATAGLAVTAATYVTIGGAAPVRAGLTLVKDARKVGRLGEGLANGPAARRARSSIRRCCRTRSPPAR